MRHSILRIWRCDVVHKFSGLLWCTQTGQMPAGFLLDHSALSTTGRDWCGHICRRLFEQIQRLAYALSQTKRSRSIYGRYGQ